MRGRETATGGGMAIAAMLSALLPVTMWAGTFEAPGIIEADPGGGFVFDVIYTSGLRECYNSESVINVSNTDVENFYADGFCEIPVPECTSFSVGLGGPIFGLLLDATVPGIVEVGYSTDCDYPCSATPTPTATRAGIPAPMSPPDCSTDPVGSFSAQVKIVPFGSPTCLENTDCPPEEFCETQLGRCGKRGLCSQRPEICLDVFDPVCGCDGYRYANSCYAAQAGIAVDHLGECEVSTITTVPTTTTSLFPPPCIIDELVIDPDNTVDALAPTAPTRVPFRVDSPTGGLWDGELDDGGAGGTFDDSLPFYSISQPGGTFEFTYTPPATPPPSIVLRVRLYPHSLGFSCEYGSTGGDHSKEFTVATTTTTVPTTTTTTTTTLPPQPTGDVPMCKVKSRGDVLVEKTKLVPLAKVQDALDKGFTEGECDNPQNGQVLCKTKPAKPGKPAKRANVLLPDSQVQRALDKGFYTLGECSPMPGEPCGPAVCGPGTTCCNPLLGICVQPGMVCIQ